MQEKVYGLREQREAILAARREEYAPRRGRRGAGHLPRGPAGEGRLLRRPELWAPRRRSRRELIATVEKAEAGGSPLDGAGLRVLHLAAIDGRGRTARCAAALCQAQQMFENAPRAGRARADLQGRAAHVDLPVAHLDWYGEFNRVRTAHYARVGLSASEGSIFPASTGIQARSDQEECLMDVLAVKQDRAAAWR
jgi:hypothetical protein